MSTFRVTGQHTPPLHGRFAIGKDSGSLYFVPGRLDRPSIDGLVLIGRGSMVGREGGIQVLGRDELLPLGTKIEIEV